MKKDVLEYWPHEDFREGQDEVTQKISDTFQTKKFIILESPPGRGKSPIAIALGSWFGSSFILTSQKLLQDQYRRSYEESAELRVIKGKGNYKCHYNDKPVNKGYCVSNDQSIIRSCRQFGLCPYYEDKDEAAASPIMLTNYSYFLAIMNSFQPFDSRKLLVCDEAHLVEDEVLDYVQFTISERMLSFSGKRVKIPQYSQVEDYKSWLNEIKENISEETRNIREEINLIKVKPKNFYFDEKLKKQRLIPLVEDEIDKLENSHERLKKLYEKITLLFVKITNDGWIFEFEEQKRGKAIVFKPVLVSNFARDYLFSHAEKILLMSATIRDHKLFAESLGIREDEYEYVEMDTNFPVENRKIHQVNTGSFARDNLDETLKLARQDVRDIIGHHQDVKGLIHTHTYKIANFLKESNISDRFIFHDSEDREAAYRRHLQSDEPTILVTPSMTVGFDFPEDLARFQIICKVPYPFLGDKRIRKRRELDEKWYALITAISLIQTYGRPIRSEEDWAITYVLDKSFDWFVKSNRDLFPQYFLEAIE